MSTFSLILSRPDFQSGLLTSQQEIDLQRYFLDVHERQANGDAFPFNLEELVPTVYTRKEKAIQALTSGYAQDTDYKGFHQLVEDSTVGGGERNVIAYRLTAATFEHLVAKKNRAIFEVYRRVFHAAAAEAIKQITKPDAGTVRALEAAAKMLRMSESAKLGMLNRYFNQFPTTQILPAYATDAPEGETSSLPTAAAKDLLLKYQVGIGPVAFNNVLEQEGYIERLTRPSRKEVDGNNHPVIRHFVSVTEKGLAYGKNGTHPNNPKETQPHWYRAKFPQLLEAVGLRASL